jgi:predicted nucleic acid-binding protein
VILVDTSAWIEYLRATGSPAHRSVRAAVENDDDLGVLDIVRLELLAGATEQGAEDLRRFLGRFTAVPTASPADHELAAALYRRSRGSGRKVRSLVDCVVAAAALRLGVPVLAQDRDYEVLADVSELQLVVS